MGTFGSLDAKDVEEYQPKVHFLKQNDMVLCDTRNAKEGTKNASEVTCLRCQKLLERIDEIEARGHEPISLTLEVQTKSPKISKRNGRAMLLEWLAKIPEEAELEVTNSYSDGPYLIAKWVQKDEQQEA